MKTNFYRVVWLGGAIATVVFNGSFELTARADEQPTKPAAAAPPKPAAKDAPTDDKKREYKSDTNPGTVFTNSIDMLLMRLPAGFWAGIYEVTQEQYQKVMNANPSAFRGERRPVDSVSYNDAVAFCNQLTELERKEESLPQGCHYSLPTEAQWESLAGNSGLETAVTSDKQRRSATENVGSLPANGLGLYDVRGNVMEWCAADPSKPYRVLRGGAWATSIEINLRPSFRHYAQPDEKQNTFGLRVVLVSD